MTGRTNLADAQEAFEQKTVMMLHVLNGGIARTAPTRACTLPTTFLALPSPPRQELCDSIANYEKKTHTLLILQY